ncbi:MAG: hypothetical protein WD425_19505 [Nitrospirales bacterium]
MRVVWAAGVEWIIKLEDERYSHRPEGDYGDWQPGIPPDTNESDMALAFNR